MDAVHAHPKVSLEKAQNRPPWFLLTAPKVPASGPAKAEVVLKAHRAVAIALLISIFLDGYGGSCLSYPARAQSGDIKVYPPVYLCGYVW